MPGTATALRSDAPPRLRLAGLAVPLPPSRQRGACSLPACHTLHSISIDAGLDTHKKLLRISSSAGRELGKVARGSLAVHQDEQSVSRAAAAQHAGQQHQLSGA